MPATALPPLISSDGHLEVLPERWTPRIPARLRSSASRQRGCASRSSMRLTAWICRPLFVW